MGRFVNSLQTVLWTTLLLFCAFSASEAKLQAEGSPNIIIILADDIGYGDLGCYGAEKIKTPNIDRLAEGGILFTDGHCGASTCTPTRYGLMTGRHAWRSWCKYSALSTNAPLLIEEDRVTIASLLKSAGYSTSIVGKWHLGYGHEEGFEKNRGDASPNSWDTRGSGPNWNGELKPGPLENGFGYAYVVPVANSFPPYVFVENYRVAGLRKESPIGKLESRNHGKMEGGEGARWTDEELIDKFAAKLVSQLESLAKKKQPFFLYYAPTQPHIGSRVVKRNSHWPNARFKGTSEAGPYGDVVQELDWSVGEILDTLDRLRLTDNTLVIFASDNGGYTRNFNGHQPNGKILRGGKGDLVEGGHRVPFLAKWPGRIKPGTRSKETISTTDMLATFAAITGKDLPAGAGPDSYNVLPALFGQKLPDPERPVVLSSGGTGAMSIRAGKWKLIDGQGNCGYGEFRFKRPHPAPKPGDPPAQLYNIEEDLGEANNLYLKHPEIVHRLKAGLEKIKADENYNPTALEQPKETLAIEQLNALFPKSQAANAAAARKPKSQATLTRIGGKIAAVSSFQAAREAAYMLDGDPSTFWHTRHAGGDAKPPHYVDLQVPVGTSITGLTYTAWTGGNENGHVKEYAISVSDDGKNWSDPILSGELKTGESNRQNISFPAPSTKPFIRFEVTRSQSPTGRFLAAIGELDVGVQVDLWDHLSSASEPPDVRGLSAQFNDSGEPRSLKLEVAKLNLALGETLRDPRRGIAWVSIPPPSEGWNLKQVRNIQASVKNIGSKSAVTTLWVASSNGWAAVGGTATLEAGQAATLKCDLRETYPDGTPKIDPGRINEIRIMIQRTDSASVDVSGLIATGTADEWQRPAGRIDVPDMLDGKPAAGRRVRYQIPSDTDSGVYCSLYLPPEWEPGKQYPVIVEYPGNIFFSANACWSTGRPEQCVMGYGISSGKDAIWVSLPFVDRDHGEIAESGFGSNEGEDTTRYAMTVVEDICINWGGDRKKLFLCGFSRGAIACGYIGLRNDKIAGLWKGFVACQHYDGSNWRQSKMEEAVRRASRFDGKAIFQIDNSQEKYQPVMDATSPTVKWTWTKSGLGYHATAMFLDDRPAMKQLRQWFRELASAEFATNE